MASLAFLFPETIAMITGMEIGLVPSLVIELAFIWIVVFLSFSKVSDSAWILNLAAVLKVGIAVVVGGLGIWYAVNYGFANDMAPATFLPSLDSNSLTYLSIILFNFMGFEVITTYVGSMENPSKQIPKAIIAGGIAIAALYLFSSFGIAAAIPALDISLDSGIMDAVGIMAGVGSVLFIVVGIVFLITLFGNMVSWSFGVNFVAEHAARKQNMPHVFAHESKKNQMPTGAAIVNGIVASVLVLLSPVMELAGFDGFFWIFFSMNIVFLLISYIPMFPAFLKLRSVDPTVNRVFKVPGGRGVLLVVTWLPVVLLVLSIIATIVPLNGSEAEMSKIPMLIGVTTTAAWARTAIRSPTMWRTASRRSPPPRRLPWRRRCSSAASRATWCSASSLHLLCCNDVRKDLTYGNHLRRAVNPEAGRLPHARRVRAAGAHLDALAAPPRQLA